MIFWIDFGIPEQDYPWLNQPQITFIKSWISKMFSSAIYQDFASYLFAYKVEINNIIVNQILILRNNTKFNVFDIKNNGRKKKVGKNSNLLPQIL